MARKGVGRTRMRRFVGGSYCTTLVCRSPSLGPPGCAVKPVCERALKVWCSQSLLISAPGDLDLVPPKVSSERYLKLTYSSLSRPPMLDNRAGSNVRACLGVAVRFPPSLSDSYASSLEPLPVEVGRDAELFVLDCFALRGVVIKCTHRRRDSSRAK